MEGFRCFLFSHHDRAALRGLMFFPSRALYSEMMSMQGEGPERPLWALEFEPAWDSPLSDLDLWERFGLPWAGEERCPVAYLLDPERVERPDSRQLAFLEGLAAALAATSEQELDSGRWEKRVSTAAGDMRFVLALPGVLEPEEAPVRPAAPWAAAERTLREVHKLIENHQFASLEEANQFLARALEQGQPKREPETPEERAEELTGQAWECPGRRAVHLARQALEIWPDCADAYNVLASRAPDDEAAHGLYVQAIAAGKRALGPETFQEHTGHFWSFLEGRPYMRAVEGVAETLRDLGRLDESVEHYREMLRLNTNDNQGGRYALVNVLIAANRDAEADELLAAHEKEDGAPMAFPRALLTFRRQGDSFDARRCLKRALQANRFVPGLLLGIRSLPAPTDTYSPGREDEAAFYYLLSYGTWEKTPGALDWLRQRASPPSQPPANGRPAGSRRKKKRQRGRG
jgi:tetratricopeptide (TPR) repeat protein